MKLSDLKGIGPSRAQALADAGINSILDLLYYFPRRYIDRTISETTILKAGEKITLMAHVQNKYVAHGRKSRLIVRCRTIAGEPLSLLWFKGVPFFRHAFHDGDLLVVSGKLDFHNGMQMVHPDFEKLDEGEEQELLHAGRIIPIYPGSDSLKKAKMDSRGLRRLIHQALEEVDLQAYDPLPAALVHKLDLVAFQTALQNMHYPENDSAKDAARYRFIIEELYLFNLLLYHRSLLRQRLARQITPLPLGESSAYTQLLEDLPFQLTGDQQRAIEHIITHCRGEHAEAYLLQGDVGSGKTLVALATALHYIDAGIQIALMAPTEVLARQHFQTISEFLGPGFHALIELLTGSDRTKTKALKRERIANGDVRLVVGTHSLIEKDVNFYNLGLVIIDEQHRFGVEQRELLRIKGRNPDLITMTATPIPRTLCLTEFSDLELLTLREKPAGRKPVQTLWLREDQRGGMYKSVRKYTAQGRQTFIVYPLISESEKVDLKAAEDAFIELEQSIFPDYRLALLHGRLKARQKEEVMRDFRAGQIQILVTTTVIEVGVDVPNATVMVIEHAERFGISQLHQLRGRVGRGSAQSFCVLMSEADSPEATERLQALVDSDDGFELAEVDLRQRGPGQLLGLRQHGVSGLRLADLAHDRKLVEIAYQAAREFPEANEAARMYIRRHFAQGPIIFPT